jgi:hypothetical protein
MYPISYSEEALGVSRDVFVRAVMAELPKPADWETTPLASGYVKPIYLSPLYQHKIAIGSAGFPFNYHQGTPYDYQEGLCPNAEKLYKSSLMVSPLVREPLSINDVNDFANAIEKVVENISQLKDRYTEINHGILTPLEAINQSAP